MLFTGKIPIGKPDTPRSLGRARVYETAILRNTGYNYKSKIMHTRRCSQTPEMFPETIWYWEGQPVLSQFPCMIWKLPGSLQEVVWKRQRVGKIEGVKALQYGPGLFSSM